MSMHIFTVFDPGDSLLSLNWLIISLPIVIWSKTLWMTKMGSILSISSHALTYLIDMRGTKEMSLLGVALTATFIIVWVEGFSGLLPYVFSSTSHISPGMTMALAGWSSVVLFSLIESPSGLLSHIVPTGVPSLLGVALVLIETISILIRPVTLTIRLVANTACGHVVLSLVGGWVMTGGVVTGVFGSLVISIMETAVVVVQSYVLSMLLAMYAIES